MVDLGREADLGRLEGVVGRERDGEEEHAAGVRRVALQQRFRGQDRRSAETFD